MMSISPTGLFTEPVMPSIDITPPLFHGLLCSSGHITKADNDLLYTVSHDLTAWAHSEWIHYTGSGYLLRLCAWTFPVLELKRLGLSKAARRLIVILMKRHHIDLLHIDAFGGVLPGFEVFDW